MAYGDFPAFLTMFDDIKGYGIGFLNHLPWLGPAAPGRMVGLAFQLSRTQGDSASGRSEYDSW